MTRSTSFISLRFLFFLFSGGKMQECKMSDYVCEELIIEIFTRLPPKSLLRFRSLSKSWYSCIGSPGFIRMQTSRSTQKLLFRHKLRYYPSLFGWDYFSHSADFCTLHSEDQLPLCPTGGYNGITAVQFPCSRNFKIVGSCDGIFCLSEYKKGISLWNPSIRRKISLPDCPRRSDLPIGIGIGLGFGFDPISNDYKIVQISYARESSFVYAVKTGTWCVIASPTPLISEVLSGWSSFVNGVLHWVVDSYHTESHDIYVPCIMTFDLSTHVFGMIPLPEPFWTYTRVITSLQGSLAVISTEHDNGCDSWIWVRRDDSWSVVFKSKENQFKGGSVLGVLQLTSNGDLLVTARTREWVKDLQVCITKMGAQQSTLVNFHAASFILEIVRCVESLHLLDMETACEENEASVSGGENTSELSVSGGRKTSKIRYLKFLFYYFRMACLLLFNR